MAKPNYQYEKRSKELAKKKKKEEKLRRKQENAGRPVEVDEYGNPVEPAGPGPDAVAEPQA
ncbi:MAG: hypothetical protein AB9900_03195 [Humidesulfovibrio sp.]